MTFVRGACIAAATLAALLSSYAPGFRHDPPGDLYSQLIVANAGSCIPGSEIDKEEARADRIRKRIEMVRPWLIAQIGEAEIEQRDAEYYTMMEGISFTGCPSDQHVQRQHMRVRRILGEMERRQRAEARLRPPPAPRASDAAH